MSGDDDTEDIFEATGSLMRRFAGIGLGASFLIFPLVLFSHSARNLSGGTRLGIIAVLLLGAAGFWFGKLVRVRIRHSDLVAEYRAWNYAVRYADIVDMDVVFERAVGSLGIGQDVIVVRLRHRLPFMLRDFDGDVADPFNKLQRRWSTWMDHAHPHWRDTPPRGR
jgi:hypothetical protein